MSIARVSRRTCGLDILAPPSTFNSRICDVSLITMFLKENCRTDTREVQYLTREEVGEVVQREGLDHLMGAMWRYVHYCTCYVYTGKWGHRDRAECLGKFVVFEKDVLESEL